MNATNAPKKLTTEEIDRMCYLSAYGDSSFDPIDDNLKAKKWVNILFHDDGEKYTEISNSAIFAANNAEKRRGIMLFSESGVVNPFWMLEAI
jgi:hypothetical protein